MCYSYPQISNAYPPNTDFLICCLQVKDATSDDLNDLKTRDDIVSLLSVSGFVNNFLTETNKEKALQDLIIFQSLKIRQAEMNEIRRGLESVGLATLLNGNQCLVKRAFAESKDIIIITRYFPV